MAKPGPVPPLRMALSLLRSIAGRVQTTASCARGPRGPRITRHSSWGRGQSAAACNPWAHPWPVFTQKLNPTRKWLPAASRPTGGGAAQSLVPPGAGLQTPARTPQAEPSSSAPAPSLLAGGSGRRRTAVQLPRLQMLRWKHPVPGEERWV